MTYRAECHSQGKSPGKKSRSGKSQGISWPVREIWKELRKSGNLKNDCFSFQKICLFCTKGMDLVSSEMVQAYLSFHWMLPIKDGSAYSLGSFRKGKTCIIAKFRRPDLVIYSHFRECKPHLIAK